MTIIPFIFFKLWPGHRVRAEISKSFLMAYDAKENGLSSRCMYKSSVVTALQTSDLTTDLLVILR